MDTQTLCEQINNIFNNHFDEHVTALKVQDEDDFEEAIQKVVDARKYSELDGDEFFVKVLLAEYDEEEGNDNTDKLILLLNKLRDMEQKQLSTDLDGLANNNEDCKEILQCWYGHGEKSKDPSSEDILAFQKVISDISNAKTLEPMTKEFAGAFRDYYNAQEEHEKSEDLIAQLNDLGKTRTVKTVAGTLIEKASSFFSGLIGN